MASHLPLYQYILKDTFYPQKSHSMCTSNLLVSNGALWLEFALITTLSSNSRLYCKALLRDRQEYAHRIIGLLSINFRRTHSCAPVVPDNGLLQVLSATQRSQRCTCCRRRDGVLPTGADPQNGDSDIIECCATCRKYWVSGTVYILLDSPWTVQDVNKWVRTPDMKAKLECRRNSRNQHSEFCTCCDRRVGISPGLPIPVNLVPMR
ncbi:hypothetical protein PIIN_01537 [Serendipita indica DSM 11827]|uniref:Uncharacterized protein n=1 Tax=Serendipita indica (strain DSM 11827) TaxID=1109443 RepID=G4T8Q1_SERID|nr:hypothetical protein PIIN_01537 [Serendipita indica DSM 11827]